MAPTALCSLTLLSLQPKCLLASSQILLFSLALIILPSLSPFQGLPEAGSEDYQPHGGERQGQGRTFDLVSKWGVLQVVKRREGGPVLSRNFHPREHSTTALFSSPHSDFQKHPDSQGRNKKLGDPRGRVQIRGATWGQECKWLNKDTA